MFPSEQGNELCFKIPSDSDHNQQHKIAPDLILDHPELLYACTDLTDTINNNTRRNRRRKSIAMNNKNEEGDTSRIANKKLMHRNIERQRRQEMTTLYSNLRSLLPIEYIKGKRSISDHMNEAVNYIKHMRMRIKELEAKRYELKLKEKVNFRNISSQVSTESSSNCSQSTGILIQHCLSGIKIVFSCGLGENGQGFTLSQALQILLEAEISVLSCVSTTINERVFHTVQTEAKDPTCFDLSELRQRLINLTGNQ